MRQFIRLNSRNGEFEETKIEVPSFEQGIKIAANYARKCGPGKNVSFEYFKGKHYRNALVWDDQTVCEF